MNPFESVMKNIYLFSGLGADHRAFKELKLPGYKLVFIDWLVPVEHESLTAYAQRLSTKIEDEHPIIIGLSFGGMVALEIAKRKKPAALFLISSARSRNDLRPLFSWLMRLGMLKIMPKTLFSKSNIFLAYLMGVQDKKEKRLLAEIIADTDVSFVFWALDAMSLWENTSLPENLVEIHGTNDRLIPFRTTPYMHEISDGGHFSVSTHAGIISQIILSYLSAS